MTYDEVDDCGTEARYHRQELIEWWDQQACPKCADSRIERQPTDDDQQPCGSRCR